MKTTVFVAGLILVAAYGAPADEAPSRATSAAQSVAIIPKGPKPASNELQDQINQQKQQIRNMDGAMKRQQKSMNAQIEKESSASHGAAKENRKHVKQASPKKAETA